MLENGDPIFLNAGGGLRGMQLFHTETLCN
jgi:hypothetical protein